MITRRNALWLIPFLFIITFPLWKIPVGSYLSPRGGYDPNFTKKKTSKHNFSMTNVTIQQADKGQQTAHIQAQKARSSRRPNEYILESVVADVINEKGDATHIVADEGNYNAERDRLKLINDVVITNTTDNYTMETGLLYYDGIKGTIYCPGKTLLKGDGIIIKGSSFSHDMSSGIYSVGGRVHSTLQERQGT